MGWQRVTFDKDGTKITEFGSYWYEDVCQWFVLLGILALAWLFLLFVAPWCWLYMKITGKESTYRMTEEQINAQNEQAALWQDRMKNFPQPGATPPGSN